MGYVESLQTSVYVLLRHLLAEGKLLTGWFVVVCTGGSSRGSYFTVPEMLLALAAHQLKLGQDIHALYALYGMVAADVGDLNALQAEQTTTNDMLIGAITGVQGDASVFRQAPLVSQSCKMALSRHDGSPVEPSRQQLDLLVSWAVANRWHAALSICPCLV